MDKLEVKIEQNDCVVYPGVEGAPLLLQPTGREELPALDSEAGQIRALCGGRAFTLAAFPVDDWNRELSPWPAPPVMGEEGFGDGAADTLAFLTDALLPALERRFAPGAVLLGGYSLAGLFSLWAGYQCARLDGVAAVSPSVWFPGWDDFAAGRRMQAGAVYLSLGLKEERARNPVLARVGDRIRLQHELLCRDEGVRQTVLEWNPGNHFAQPDARLAKGFSWLLLHTGNCRAS